MFLRLRRGPWLIASAFLMASCSAGDASRLSAPTASSAPTGEAALVGSHAAGDVKVGTGSLDLVRLRMDRQSAPGISVFRQYANPGGAYRIEVGETIELWAEYEGAANPRLIVNWGDGSDDFTGCGSCLLTHKYTKSGVFTVTVILDDRVSTRITRTFTLSTELVCAPPALNTGTLPFPFFREGSAVLFETCGTSSAGASALFTGTDLQYSMSDACAGSSEVSALQVCTISLNTSTGLLSWTCEDRKYCLQITASNSCGSASTRIFSSCSK